MVSEGWRPGVPVGSEAPFSEEEIRAALTPHLVPEEARAEAETIAGTLGDAPITGAELNDDVLAMLHVTSAELAARVDAYRAEIWARRRGAWLRRELHAARAGAMASEDQLAAVEAELETQWRERRDDAEREWTTLLGRVRAAVERYEQTGIVGTAGAGGSGAEAAGADGSGGVDGSGGAEGSGPADGNGGSHGHTGGLVQLRRKEPDG